MLFLQCIKMKEALKMRDFVHKDTFLRPNEVFAVVRL